MTKVAIESVDATRRRLAVEVPAGAVAAEIERAYDVLRRKATVRGFRQGRVPRPILERVFGEQVRADVFGKLVHESYYEALRERHIEPVGQPEIITEHAEPGHALRYSATVEVKPEVRASGYANLDVERPLTLIDEPEIDQFLEGLRQSVAQLRPVTDRQQVCRGDVATVDYEAHTDGRLVGRGEGRLVEVGGEQAGPFGARLEGAAVAAASEFEIEYPADQPNRELAGRRVSFRVLVKSLAGKEVPPLDDEFAKNHGDSDSLAALRERVRGRLETAATAAADDAVRANVVSQLIAAHDFEVPQAMVERRAEALVDELLNRMGEQRPPASREADVRQQLHSEAESRARSQVKASLLLEAIATQEDLTISDQELEVEIDRLVDRAGSARERVRALYQESTARESLQTRVRQERALALVIKQARVRTVEQRPSVAAGVGNR